MAKELHEVFKKYVGDRLIDSYFDDISDEAKRYIESVAWWAYCSGEIDNLRGLSEKELIDQYVAG